MFGRFVVRSILFCLPLSIVLGFPWLVILLAGELRSVSSVVEAQNRSGMLYGAAYNDFAVSYKLQGVRADAPKLIALGTSRVMGFNRRMFRDDAGFYNAGGGITKIRHLSTFLDQIPADRTPETIIIALDQYFFNPNWDDLADDNFRGRLVVSEQLLPRLRLTNWRGVYSDVAEGKVRIGDVVAGARTMSAIGVAAIMRSSGFRPDGSYTYGSELLERNQRSYRDYQFKDTLARIQAGRSRFEPAMAMSPAAVEYLRTFLDASRARGIHVSAFLPPYAHAVYLAMAESRKYGYLDQLMPSLLPELEGRGFTLFDFSDLAWLGASDAESVDGVHGSEKAYGRMLIAMADRDAKLARYVDVARLRTAVADSTSDQAFP